MLKRLIILFTFLALSLGIYAQADKARSLFSEGKYSEANQLYEMAASTATDDATREKYYKLANKAATLKDLRLKADKAYKANDHESAKSYYNKVLAQNPNDPVAKSRLKAYEDEEAAWKAVVEAQSLEETKQKAQAYLKKYPKGLYIVDATQKMLDANEEQNRILSLKSQADSAFEARNYSLALEKYNEYLQYDAGNTEASSKRDRAEEEYRWEEIAKIDKPTTRIDAIEEYLKKYPNGVHTDEANEFTLQSTLLIASEGIAAKAEDALLNSKYQEAYKLYKQAAEACTNQEFKEKYTGLAKGVNEANTSLLKADKEFKAKNYKSAQELYKKVLECNPNDTHAKSRESECSEYVKKNQAEDNAWYAVLYAETPREKGEKAAEYLKKYPSGRYKSEAKKIAAENPVLLLSSTDFTTHAEGGEKYITVTCNAAWSISSDYNSMYSLSREGDKIHIVIKRNTTGEYRSAYFYVKTNNGELRARVTLSQFAEYSSSYTNSYNNSSYRSSSANSYSDSYSSSYSNTRSSNATSYSSSISSSSSRSSSNDSEASTYARFCEKHGVFDMTWLSVGGSVGLVGKSSTESDYNNSSDDYYYNSNGYYNSSDDLVSLISETTSVGAAAYFSLLRMRIGWFQLCPGEFAYSKKDGGDVGFLYQPSVNFVIPVSEDHALYFGGGPSISFSEDDDIWFKVEAGCRAYWSKNWCSDFFLRYDGMFSVGLNIGL